MNGTVSWLVQGGFVVGVLAFMWKMNMEFNKKSANFVSKEMCHLMHNHTTEDFKRLEAKVDDGFKMIDKKITELMKQRA